MLTVTLTCSHYYSKLRHPQIVLFLGACLTPPHICILTEFLERGNLAEVLRDRKLPWRTKVSMACYAAQGMNYLHQSKPKVVHRDLKSLNLLVDENYHVKVPHDTHATHTHTPHTHTRTHDTQLTLIL